jgi:hypothetical protein
MPVDLSRDAFQKKEDYRPYFDEKESFFTAQCKKNAEPCRHLSGAAHSTDGQRHVVKTTLERASPGLVCRS